jgi:peptidoglycan/LPS O-acetylase OafA/YrhL
MTASYISYRPDVDGLRAIAVLSVVLCHAGLGFAGGYVGVDVFFVISGYLITSLIVKDIERGTFSLAAFWERRIRRILPALATVTVATLLAGWFLLMPDAYASLGKSVVGLALLISNVHFVRDTGYFEAAAAEKPLLHTWSLAVEEQFYLCVPVFLLLLARNARSRRAAVLLAVALVVSLGWSIYGTHRYPVATFYLLPSRAWELFAGALLAFLPVSWLSGSSRCKEFAAALGLACILIPCVAYDQNTRFPGLAALPPVLGTALLIWSGNASAVRLPITSRCLAWRPLVFVGLISYSLYLWHWPVFAFARSQSILPLSYSHRFALVVASVSLGAISWRYVELPFRSRRVLASRRRLLTVTVLVFAGLLCTGLSVFYNKGFEKRLSPEARWFAAAGQRDLRYWENLDVADIPRNLVRFGNGDGPPELLVWGDSHAMAILPAIDSLCQETAVAACAATHTSTAPVTDYFVPSEHGLNDRAIPFNAAVLDYVRSERIRTVVLVAYWSSYFTNAEFPSALLRTIDALQANGVTVYFMNDVPVFAFDVPKALARYSMLGENLSGVRLASDEYEAANQFQTSFLPQLIERGVHILDPIPILRTRTKSIDILPFDSGGSFYSDKQHLSTYGALAIKPVFAPMFQRLRSQARLISK